MNDSLSLPSLPGDFPLNGIDSAFSPPTISPHHMPNYPSHHSSPSRRNAGRSNYNHHRSK